MKSKNPDYIGAELRAALLALTVKKQALISGRVMERPGFDKLSLRHGGSQTAGDYTLTLEDALVDDNGVILLLTFFRVDGEPFTLYTFRNRSLTTADLPNLRIASVTLNRVTLRAAS